MTMATASPRTLASPHRTASSETVGRHVVDVADRGGLGAQSCENAFRTFAAIVVNNDDFVHDLRFAQRFNKLTHGFADVASFVVCRDNQRKHIGNAGSLPRGERAHLDRHLVDDSNVCSLV